LCPPHIGLSSELTHAGRPYEPTLLVSTVLVYFYYYYYFGCPTELPKFAVLTVSDKLCICDISTKLNSILYTLLMIGGGGVNAAEGDGPPLVEVGEGD